MLHQFEEYVLPGGFQEFFNTNIYNPNGFIRFKINNTSVFHVNVTLGWTAYLFGAFTGNNPPLFLTILLVITLINGIVHTIAFVVLRKYNPGFITGLLLFIPFSVYSITKFANERIITKVSWFSIIIFAITGTLLIPLILYLSKK